MGNGFIVGGALYLTVIVAVLVNTGVVFARHGFYHESYSWGGIMDHVLRCGLIYPAVFVYAAMIIKYGHLIGNLGSCQ